MRNGARDRKFGGNFGAPDGTDFDLPRVAKFQDLREIEFLKNRKKTGN